MHSALERWGYASQRLTTNELTGSGQHNNGPLLFAIRRVSRSIQCFGDSACRSPHDVIRTRTCWPGRCRGPWCAALNLGPAKKDSRRFGGPRRGLPKTTKKPPTPADSTQLWRTYRRVRSRINKHLGWGRAAGIGRANSANPCTPVRFWPTPPLRTGDTHWRSSVAATAVAFGRARESPAALKAERKGRRNGSAGTR